ncbi:class I SAM-dependent methyltransferase [Caenibacillus caldisaponilyticus]|uniref:class I SAM-dependent methyltransferase n=1 Tax=Caenibacillus caldisaponilyticus TaxID=1674942 RepID=UPI000988497D|nr:class I SAM-dependent methyltransferase [Caenibacillus caldisaponilyticus]
MKEHYFSQTPQSESRPRELDVEVGGVRLSLRTDRGVFSKDAVDYGSRLLIETFVPPETDGPLLDIGCGYGVIGLAVAKRYPNRPLVMADINERAVSLADFNARQNGVEADVYQSDLYENVTGHFAAILSNPPIRAGKKVVHDLFAGARDRLLTGGELWVVIQKKQGAPSALKKLQELYGDAEIVERSKGYHILRAVKGADGE